jgi:hypothetical protein
MRTALRLLLCWFAFIAALFLSGAVGAVLHLHAQSMHGASVQSMLLAQLGAGLVLVIGLWPLARSLAAPPMARAASFVAFLLLAFGVNGMIEALKFTSFLDAGIGIAVVFYICVAVFLGTAVGLCFGSSGQAAGLPHRSWTAFTWRIVAAGLSWPVIYFFFGMCIAPIVTPYYRAGIAGLRIPPLHVVIEAQLLRSILFLVATLPFVALWKGSRRNLWLALGIAHAFTVGLYGIAGGPFLPTILRVTHGIEMTCDAFAYAAVLVLLFTPAKEELTERKEEATRISVSA